VSLHPPGEEKRSERRRRTRLRAGKILDCRNAFLIECLVHDRSPDGARLRLVAPVALPDSIRLFEDEDRRLAAADVIWRNGQEIGIRFRPGQSDLAMTARARAAMAGPYYAVAERSLTRR